MAEPMRTTRRINLENLEALEFTRTRRGYEPDEVRGALGTISRQIRSLIEERDRLSDQLARTEQKLADVESRPAAIPDRAELTKLLGEEMVRLLDSAKETGEDIVSNARTEAGDILDAAEAEAVTREAAIAAAEAEAAERAEEAAAVRMAAAEADADKVRAQMEEELEAAKTAAKAQLDASREEGREMIVEARKFRETILRDLAGRRKLARKQLEAMRAAQERLLDAFTSCAAAVEGATSELHTALPAAKAAADIAAQRVDDDIEQVVSELESAIHTGELPALVLDGFERPKLRSKALPRTEASASDGETDDGSADPDLPPAAEADPSPDAEFDDAPDEEVAQPTINEAEAQVDDAALDEPEPEPEAAPHSERPVFGVINGDGEAEADRYDDDEDDFDYDYELDLDEDDDAEDRPALRLLASDTEDDSESDDAALDAEDLFVELEPTAELAAVAAAVEVEVELDDDIDEETELDEGDLDTIGDPVFDDDIELEADDGEFASDDVDTVGDLFARLRADRDAAVDAARDILDTAEHDVLDVQAEDAEAIIEERDELVGQDERTLARRLKRVLDDEQNDVLDRLRRAKKGADLSECLPSATALLDSYLDGADAELTHAVSLGAAALATFGVAGRPIDPAATAETLAPVLDALLVEPWHAELIAAIEDADGDRAAAVTAVRTAYRYRKMDHVADLAGSAIVMAWNAGLLAAAKDLPLEWVVSHTDDPDAVGHFGPMVGGDLQRSVRTLVEGIDGRTCRCTLAPIDRT